MSNVIIIWGGELSQSVAEQVASQLGDGTETTTTKILSMESFGKPDLSSLSESVSTAILILQTVENNQPPEDAGKFLRYFKRKTHPSSMLTDKLTFSVLGLGDSNLLLDRQTTTAKDCNACGQLLDRRLEELGGTRFHPLGLADERTGMEEVSPWIESLKDALTQL